MADFIISHRQKDVIWQDMVNVAAQPTANDLEKTGGVEDVWDAGARSQQILRFGGVSFKAGQTDKNIVCGLSADDPDQNFDTIDFAIIARADNQIKVVENGVTKSGPANSYTVNDILSLEINVSGFVEYKKNGSTFYTSSISPSFPLFVDTSIRELVAQIIDVQLLPGKTISIYPLESYSVDRPLDFQQSWQETSGGVVLTDELGPNIQFTRLNIKNLPGADMDTLKDFIINAAKGQINFFDFTDDLGVDYDKCRFKTKRVDPLLKSYQLYNYELLLRQDID